jgi:hypothetical protein
MTCCFDSCVVAVGFYGNREAEKGLEGVTDAAGSVINAVKNAQLQVSVWFTYNCCSSLITTALRFSAFAPVAFPKPLFHVK